MLEANSEDRDSALNELQSQGVDLVSQLACSSKEGSEVLQRALNLANPKSALGMARQLKGHIAKAVRSPHANHVVQEIIRLIPLNQIDFVVQEVEQMGLKLVFHKYGCRILCRLIESDCSMQSSDKSMVCIVERVLQRLGDIIYDIFGHFVVESILEHGQDSHRAKILTELKANAIRAAHHDRGAFVVVKAMQYGCPEDVEDLSKKILAQGPEKLAGMASTWSGQNVIRALMQKTLTRQSLSDSFSCPAALANLRTNKYGRDILKDLKQTHS